MHLWFLESEYPTDEFSISVYEDHYGVVLLLEPLYTTPRVG